MSTTTTPQHPATLFERARVTRRDEMVFVTKLTAATCLLAIGAFLALLPGFVVPIAGAVLLGATYAHLVELQHQCLHHSAFRRPRLHRFVGIPLGVPMLVSYSHYRVRHLQHHRYLGTAQDSEFFGFDTRKPLTWGTLLRGLLDYQRLVPVFRDIARSCTGRWRYDIGQIGERRRREIMSEYRLLGVFSVVALVAIALGFGEFVLWLWILPFIVAVPIHFLVELPEHALCDPDTTDILRNTRSIRGGRFSTWFTNGNNLHIEHHAAMMVPINRLRGRHDTTARHAVHVQRTYPEFARLVMREIRRNTRTSETRRVDGASERAEFR